MRTPHGTDAKRWAQHFVTAIEQDPSILSEEDKLVRWFGAAIEQGVSSCRERMFRHAALRSRSHGALGHYISHHCATHPVPHGDAPPSDLVELVNSDRGLLTMAREYLFAATRDELVFPDDDYESNQDTF